MGKGTRVTEKYEYCGLPSLVRPDIKPPAGWDLTLVAAQEHIRGHNLSPNGEQIAFIRDSETLSDIFCISSNGGWPRRISTNRLPVAYWDDEIPQWSPDSQLLAFTMGGHVHVTERNKLPVKLTDFTQSAWSPRWLPDSTGLIVSSSRYDADQLLLTDKAGSWPRQLTNSSDGDHWDARPSPDGKYLAFTFRPFGDLNRMDICVIELASGSIRPLYGKPKVRTRDPRWSPDGRWITFISQEAGQDDLWILGIEGGGLRRLTKLGYDIVQYCWNPSNSEILITINRNGAYDLSLLDPETGVIIDLRIGLGVHLNPGWSQDGKFITFEYQSPVQPSEIYRMELSSKTFIQLTFSAAPALSAAKMVLPERLSYQSFDGLEIPAFLFKPENPNGAAILHPHGGPSAQYNLEWDVMAQYFVAKGYTFLAINYRGSTGYGVEFEHANYNDWGMGDTKDCIFGAKYLDSLAEIDPTRIAIMGSSYGGYLCNCALARDPEYLFACGIAKYGDANILSSWAHCKRELRLYTEIFLGHPANNRQIYWQSSPIYDVGNIKNPILLLHGLQDEVVPPEASEEWATALRLHGKSFEYKTYAGEAHGFLQRETIMDVNDRIERFLDWHLLA